MMLSKRFYLTIFIICGAILFLTPFLSDQNLHLVFCDVGQGDGILIKYKNLQAIIDGGSSGSRMVECLSENIPPWDRKVELMILTHPDSDHLTGLINVLERYNVNQIVVNSIVKESSAFWEFHQRVLAEAAQIYSPQAGDKLKLGPIDFLILWPKEKLGDSRVWSAPKGDLFERICVSPRQSAGSLSQNAQERKKCQPTGGEVLAAAVAPDKTNETSIVLKLSFGDFDTLLPGDIGFTTENQIDFPEVEVLKIPHHGSKYSTSDDLLKESSPELAIISVGKNSFGHPTKEVLEKLGELGINVLRTDQEGEIEIISDGTSWAIKN